MKAVFTFARMQPITIGHEKLVNKVKQVAQVIDAKPLVYLSQTHDSKRNPLSYLTKLSLALNAFGDVVQPSDAKTIIDVMKDISLNAEDVVMVVGSDRVDEFTKLLHKYNGKDYTFRSIMVVSAGERDADSDDVDGMSATKMRQAAIDGSYSTFIDGLPKSLYRVGNHIMSEIRKSMEQ